MRDKQKQEAIRRMKALGIHGNAVHDIHCDLLNYSECGILYWVEDENWLEQIREFEEKYSCMVYHVIRSYTSFGECLSCLYVSAHEDEWGMDWDDLSNNEAYAYVINLDAPDCSEIGLIRVAPFYGGMVRVA